MKGREIPRVVAIGRGAGLERVVAGLAASLCAGGCDRYQPDCLIAVVPGIGDLEGAAACERHGAGILPASRDSGRIRRVSPEVLRRLINADLIVAGPCERGALEEVLAVEGIGSTLPAVRAVRVLVTPPSAGRPRRGEEGFGTLFSRPGLFHYWLSGGSRLESTDSLMEDLVVVMAEAAPQRVLEQMTSLFAGDVRDRSRPFARHIGKGLREGSVRHV